MNRKAKMSTKKRGWGFLLLLFFFPPIVLAEPVNIPLTVHELLPGQDCSLSSDPKDLPIGGLVGAIERPANDPASFGVPLMDSHGVTIESELGLLGASVYQFRIINRYPSGNAQWVLVDALIPGGVEAEGEAFLTLVNAGASSGSPLAVNNTDNIAVNTGAAEFVIRKNGFNGLDSVTVGGVNLISSGNNGGITLTTSDNAIYSSLYDNPTVSILENGPAKAIVKAEGRLKTSGGSIGPMGYTLYLTFYKNASWLKAVLVVRNAYQDSKSQISFKGIEWNLHTSIQSGSYSFSANPNNFSGSLSTTENNIWLMQGFTKHMSPFEYHSPNPLWEWFTGYGVGVPVNYSWGGSGDIGVRVVENGTTSKAFSNDMINDFAGGLGELNTLDGPGITAVYKDMAAYFPASMEFNGDGTVVLGMYSKRNSKSSNVFDWATHESREFLLDFHTTAIDNELAQARLQTPLFGRASFDHYRASGSFLGETRIASYDEQKLIYAAHGRTDFQIKNQPREAHRYWNHSWGGRDNQRDKMLADQIQYIQTGHGGQMLNALSKATYMSDQFPWHSDGFDGASAGDMESYNRVGAPINGAVNFNKHESDFEHIWIYGLFTSYYFTGDERFKIAIEDLSESLYNRYNGGSDAYIFVRLGIAGARMAALSYMFTGQTRYLDKLNKYIIKLLSTKYTDGSYGRSMERGFFMSPYDVADHTISPLFSNSYMPLAIVDVLRHTPPDHMFQSSTYPGLSYSKEDLSDFLEGLSWFIFKEAFVFPPNGGSSNDYIYPPYNSNGNLAPGRPGIPYLYTINVGAECPDNDAARIYGDSGMLGAWGYESSGSSDLLQRAVRVGVNMSGDQLLLSDSEIGLLRLLYNAANPPSAEPGMIAVNAVHNGGGNYTLSWTVPEGVGAYQLKFADKSIVPNLNFERTNCQYEYTPTEYTPFWAADNYIGEPMPATPGSIQTMTVSDLPFGENCHFALRSTGGSFAPPSPIERPLRLRRKK